MPKNRSHALANLGAELLDRLPLEPGVPYKMTRTNPDFCARLISSCGAANTAQSERAGSMLSSYFCGTGYTQRVPDPTGRNTNPARSGYFMITPDGVAFKQSHGDLRIAMKQEMIRRFRKYSKNSGVASRARKKAKANAERAAADREIQPNNSEIPAAPTIHPETMEMKTTHDGFIVIKMKDSLPNRKKVAELFVK